MKKCLLTIILLCVCSIIHAQSFVGGTIGYALETDGDGHHTTHSFVVAPEAGYNFNKTWALGVSLPVNCSNIYDNTVTTISLMPYLRSTFARAGKVDFFGELALGYGWAINDGDATGVFQAGLRPGFLVNISDKFGLVFRTTLLGYSNYHSDGSDNFDVIDFSIGNNFAAGVQFTF